jgi:glycosyltransferase involved in cell wall biosynthesis
MRTYWTAHALAKRSHDVQVVTNAKEATPPFRMLMRQHDWQLCEADYGAGRVAVHWTDPVDRSQSYLPMASPFVSKLAAIAARVHSERPFDVIFSHYIEPYGIAGHLAAQIMGVPHVVRMAGSDAGRLWHHPQLETLYDHVLRSAQAVIATGAVAERAIARGVDPARIGFAGGFRVPEELFAPAGAALDVAALRAEVATDPDVQELLWGEFKADRPYFGVYGKLGERKGSLALLAAMQQLKRSGMEVGLVALAHGRTEFVKEFRATVRKLDIVDRVLQIPFIPHWRVPEFLRGCLAVCCLEQDFPIVLHTPIIPLEILLCGRCLVGSTEVIRKLPDYERLPHGYGCVAIEDVNDVELLARHLGGIVSDPVPATAVGARGCAFARELQRETAFPHALERILAAAASRHPITFVKNEPSEGAKDTHGDLRFPLTRLAVAAMAKTGGTPLHGDGSRIDLTRAREVLASIESSMRDGQLGLCSLASAVRLEMAIVAVEQEPVPTVDEENSDPLFALRLTRWALDEGDLVGLVPVCDQRMRILAFDFDISEFRGVRRVAELPAVPRVCASYLAVFAGENGMRDPVLIDRKTARIFELSDGTRTVGDICEQLQCDGAVPKFDDDLAWIETLFVRGLLRLRHA